MNKESEEKFYMWFNELENSEKFWTDLDWFGKDYLDMSQNLDNPKSHIEYSRSQTRMKEWLKKAFQCGYNSKNEPID